MFTIIARIRQAMLAAFVVWLALDRDSFLSLGTLYHFILKYYLYKIPLNELRMHKLSAIDKTLSLLRFCLEC